MDSLIIWDADSVKYASSAAIQKLDRETEVLTVEPVHHAYRLVNNTVDGICEELQSRNIEAYLTKMGDRTNFRYEYFSAYKENRLKQDKPVFLSEVHEYILKKYSAVEAVGEEADDLVSIRQYEMNPLGFKEEIKDSIIVSIDKDLDTVPGWHYNYRKKILYFVTELEAKKNFYLQILTGDKSDNVPRVRKGWIQKKAEAEIKKALSEKGLFEVVYATVCFELEKQKDQLIELHEKELNVRVYDFGTMKECLAMRFIERNGRVLWMRTKKDEIWEIPSL